MFDFETLARLGLEDLAGLLPSTPLAFGVALMTPRQLAYIFGLARRSAAHTAIEIGRYRGGATIVLAASIAPGGTMWSINDGSLELAAPREGAGRSHDDQIRDRRNTDEVGRAVREAIDEGTFKLVCAVDRMAHLQRVR